MTEQNFDDEDVVAALLRVTSDGPGFADPEDLPPSDFISFDSADVEKEDDK